MFICEIWLFDWYFPQFRKSDMSKYGYLEVFQRVPSTSRYRESSVIGLSLCLSANVDQETKGLHACHSQLISPRNVLGFLV